MRKPQSALIAGVGLALFFLLLPACGGGNAGGDTTCGEFGTMDGDRCDCDAGYSASADGLSCEADEPIQADQPDADSQADASDDAVSLAFNPSSATGSVGEAEDGSQVLIFEAMDDGVMLRLELYAAFGAPTSPGTVEMTTAETDYSTCGTCIMVRTGCVFHHDHYDCTQNFMPRAQGELHINAIGSGVGERFTGELKDLVLQQVSIGQGYVTTPVAGGDVLSLDSWSFDVQLDAL